MIRYNKLDVFMCDLLRAKLYLNNKTDSCAVSAEGCPKVIF